VGLRFCALSWANGGGLRFVGGGDKEEKD